MVGELITDDFQYEWAGTLLMGSGATFEVETISGLDDLPDVESSDSPWDAAYGSDPGRDLARDRTITASGDFMAEDDATMAADLAELRASLTVGLVSTFAWRHPGEDARFVYARCRRRSIPVDVRRALGSPTWTAQWVAVDPLVYSATEQSGSTGRVEAGSGFTSPFTPPFTLGASVSGSVRIDNDGSVAGPWTARLDGPLTNPVISNGTERLAFTANGGLDLAAGEFVLLDSRDRSVLLAGTADRRLVLSVDSRWWNLLTGENDFTLTADAGTGTLTVTGRDTWL